MKKGNGLIRFISYLLVGLLILSLGIYIGERNVKQSHKLAELQDLLESRFIGEIDETQMMDNAAAGMVAGLGDRWSYYIPAAEYDAYMEQMENAYVGIGITISTEDMTEGFKVLQVEPGSGAVEAGILPGDLVVAVEGQRVIDLGVDTAKAMIRGDEGTQVNVTVRRGEEELTYPVTRKLIQVAVATGEMLEDNIGLVTIANFDARCAEETIAAIEKLLADGAQALVFDVRNNPGGYKDELVKILDYLLPEGPLFRSISYTGKETVDESDEKCLEMPMAVLMNGESYSAAEFFAAALEEYGWAVTVGNHTVGKSYFQTTFRLSDGSAVGLSIGKYCTPNGVTLAEVGGLAPNIPVEISDETAANIYADLLDPADDPQIQAAVESVKSSLDEKP
ncbi:MAG: PDZ domain-containing protein [Oscillospiraceae bacterium]|nr:PDZ domain-containing protein [Oscillospiraceae bacterium]